ncbi:MAG: hypothetical protein EZS28_007859 [Streblomastix strix]|uniref:Uncharacterized protein n=1 Tax=Streblomastix strix TaxID=222440 RepID=A0A5J4WPW8_9EUKA|nr:MAG: hypothetical protein EZS28_007859 [Streblomastix strix]
MSKHPTAQQMQSTYGSTAGGSTFQASAAAAKEKYDFVEIRGWVDQFPSEDNARKTQIIQQLLNYMTKFPELCIKLYEETPLRDFLVQAQRTSLPHDLKQLVDSTLSLLEAHRSSIQFGAESFLNLFRPILLKPEYQSHPPNTQIVKYNHSGQVTVPFDPVFTYHGATIRPIVQEKVKLRKAGEIDVVDRRILQAQSTVEGGVIYCDIVWFNDLLLLDNAQALRVGILDADIPLVSSSNGSIWINGEYDDAPTPEDKWIRGIHIQMEADLNSNPRTLRFFVGGRQISRYITNIPARIRFFATTILDGDWFQVASLCLQDNPIGKLRSGDTPLAAEDDLFDYTNGL